MNKTYTKYLIVLLLAGSSILTAQVCCDDGWWLSGQTIDPTLELWYPDSNQDGSGNGNNGVIFNCVNTFGVGYALHSCSAADRARYYNTTTTYINVGDISAVDFSSGDFTFSVWAKVHSHIKSWYIAKDAAGNRQFLFGYDSWNDSRDEIQIGYFTGAGQVYLTSDPNPITDNDWHHIVALRRGNSFEIYVDSVLIKSGTEAGSHGIMNATSSDLNIGRRSYVGSPQYFHGTIDAVRIYSKALSHAEIDNLYLYDNIDGACAPVPTARKRTFMSTPFGVKKIK